MTTANTNTINSVATNFFPQLRVNKAGHVWRWQVRCGMTGVVVLAIWRGEITVSITLVGKHYIPVPEGMQDQLVTYDVPVEETVLVEAGDFVGFHYDNIEPTARVTVLDATHTPEGVHIESMYNKNVRDNTLPTGTTLVDLKASRQRLPSLALYIV